MKALDAGCGQGSVAVYLSKSGGLIEGITVVPFEVDDARSLAKANNVENNARFYLMDYSCTVFPDKYFDVVYTVETLSHASNMKKTLNELNRVLKRRGRVVFFEYAIEYGSLTPREKTMISRIAYGSAMDGLRFFETGTFEKMLKKSGFKKIIVEDITENVMPTLDRFNKMAMIPYVIVRLFGLQKKFPNMSSAVEFHKMAKKGLVKYCVFEAQK
jgi:ubiquinone/menaquinone biosynthesis C-methylase UbiE